MEQTINSREVWRNWTICASTIDIIATSIWNHNDYSQLRIQIGLQSSWWLVERIIYVARKQYNFSRFLANEGKEQAGKIAWVSYKIANSLESTETRYLGRWRAINISRDISFFALRKAEVRARGMRDLRSEKKPPRKKLPDEIIRATFVIIFQRPVNILPARTGMFAPLPPSFHPFLSLFLPSLSLTSIYIYIYIYIYTSRSARWSSGLTRRDFRTAKT